MSATLQEIEKNVDELKSFNIPLAWNEFVHKSFMRDCNNTNRMEDLPQVLEKYSWLRDTKTKNFETICFIMRQMGKYTLPAITIRQLLTRYCMDKGLDFDILANKKTDTLLRMRFSRCLDTMIEADLLDSITLSPEEVGKGKRTVTIYLSPFAEGKHIEKCKKMYLNRGGLIGAKKPKNITKWAEGVIKQGEAVIEARKRSKNKQEVLKKETSTNECPKCKEKYPSINLYCENGCVESVGVELIEIERDDKQVMQCPDCLKVYPLNRKYCLKEDTEGRKVWDCTREQAQELAES